MVAASNKQLINMLYAELSDQYQVKRLGSPTNLLGWKVQYNQNGIHVSQPKLAEKALQTYRMSQCKGKRVPTAAGIQLKAPNDEDKAISDEQATRYRSAVGDLRYMVDSNRPDIAFVTGRLAMANKTPTQRH